MKVVIAGGSGFIGRALAAHLGSDGHDVVVLTRAPSGRPTGGRLRQVQWAPDGSAGPWAAEVDGADAIVNLAGAGIADRRWTAARKAELRTSRVLPTRSLVAAVRQATARPATFIQGSAIGYYGTAREGELDESSPPGDDALGTLCVAWEAEAHGASALGCRLVILRTAPVIAGRGGVVERMRLPFMLFVGGPVASGAQYISWIHIDDWIAMVAWALSTPAADGVFNATSPTPVTNEVFSAALGRALRRPSWLRAPAFALRLIFGQLADALLVKGQRAIPRRALDLGFTFEHPVVDEALAHAMRRR